jgi:hypothetical protein
MNIAWGMVVVPYRFSGKVEQFRMMKSDFVIAQACDALPASCYTTFLLYNDRGRITLQTRGSDTLFLKSVFFIAKSPREIRNAKFFRKTRSYTPSHPKMGKKTKKLGGLADFFASWR